MRKISTALFIAIAFAAPVLALDEGPANFGGNGAAWELVFLGGNPYWSRVDQANHTKDWNTSTGEVRFTQPGDAEGNAGGNSVIIYFPCPGTQVYPGSNARK